MFRTRWCFSCMVYCAVQLLGMMSSCWVQTSPRSRSSCWPPWEGERVPAQTLTDRSALMHVSIVTMWECNYNMELVWIWLALASGTLFLICYHFTQNKLIFLPNKRRIFIRVGMVVASHIVSRKRGEETRSWKVEGYFRFVSISPKMMPVK